MTSKRPFVAISPSVTSEGFIRMRQAYFNAIWDAGGIPVFLAYTDDEEKIKEYAGDFDGFLFAGGVDVDPKYYGEEIKFESVEVSEARDRFEFALYAEVIKTRKPILGICRGVQFLNVAEGGSLFQHIDGHKQKDGIAAIPQHVRVLADTPLRSISGADDIFTNSFHHQAVKEVAPTLRPAALTDDGICESVFMPDRDFYLGVQWHPELYYSSDSAASSLFRAFVSACM